MSTTPSTVSLSAQLATSKPHKRNLFLRIIDALAESGHRKAERELAAFRARHGSQFSDAGLS
jgi:hypothetical protein